MVKGRSRTKTASHRGRHLGVEWEVGFGSARNFRVRTRARAHQSSLTDLGASPLKIFASPFGHAEARLRAVDSMRPHGRLRQGPNGGDGSRTTGGTAEEGAVFFRSIEGRRPHRITGGASRDRRTNGKADA